MRPQQRELKSNWSGSVPLRPAHFAHPRSEEELCELVRKVRSRGGTLRAVGSGHSSSGIFQTQDTLVRLDELSGLYSHEESSGDVWVGAGTTLNDLGHVLLKSGRGLMNYGDVDVQTIVGAVATGTHGSGKRLQNLATMLTGARVVIGTGEARELTMERDPQILRALRVSLGALGVCASVRISTVKAYRLERKEWGSTFEPAMAAFGELADAIRNVDMYWYPRSDEVKIRTLDEPGKLPASLPSARLVFEECGWAADILPRKRDLRFEEMEYALPADAGPHCMREIRDRVKARHRRYVGWRVLYRLVAADDAYLSTASEKDVVTISLHHNAGLPYDEYFSDIEPIFRAHGGRPHWAKKHSLGWETLQTLYPRWREFQRVRRDLDPEGIFRTREMRELLG